MCIERTVTRFALHAARSRRLLALVIISLDRDDYSVLVTISLDRRDYSSLLTIFLDRDDYSPLDTTSLDPPGRREARGREAANARPRSITIGPIIGSQQVRTR